MPIYLEWAPANIFRADAPKPRQPLALPLRSPAPAAAPGNASAPEAAAAAVDAAAATAAVILPDVEDTESSTIYVKNLAFATGAVSVLFSVSVFFLESCMIVSFDRFGIYCLGLAWSVSLLLHSLCCLEHLLLVCHCPISCPPIYKYSRAVPSSYIGTLCWSEKGMVLGKQSVDSLCGCHECLPGVFYSSAHQHFLQVMLGCVSILKTPFPVLEAACEA